MRSKKELIHRCDFCSKHYHRRDACAHHEEHCFKNPHREPYLGELTTAHSIAAENAGAGNAPPWWPGDTGLMFTEYGWVRIPGYEVTWYSIGPNGFAPEETWPEHEGKPLDESKWSNTEGAVLDWLGDEEGTRILKPGVEVVCQAQGLSN